MSYHDELEILNAVWEQLPIEEKKRLLSEDGWDVLIDDLTKVEK